jgi:NADH-quinone oxidoreductase subunit G
MAKIKLNGNEVEVKDGGNLIDEAEKHGVSIPKYCYHPGLSVAGQCRMCLCEVDGSPKLQIACNTRCKDGMDVVTNSEKVNDAVKTHLEFHLINHPIDCPICDQAGECGLQDYYMKHGKYESAMEEQKNMKPKVQDLGEHIVLDKERCILCSRCVRFTDEVSKTRELGIFSRGERSVIGTYEDKPLTGNYQVNTVDICPVGALTSKDFRFEQRVWFLEETESVCSGCSKGCNVKVHHKKGRHIYGLKPRYNEEINEWWMCDKGRYTYKQSNFDRRLTKAKLGGIDMPFKEAVSNWANDLRLLVSTERSEQIGIWISPHQTNEELEHIFQRFHTHFGVTKFFSENAEEFVNQDKAVDDFLLMSDPYPNSRGFLKALKDVSLSTQPTEKLVEALENKSITHLVVIAPDSERVIPMLSQIASDVGPEHFVAVLTPQAAALELFPTALGIPTLSHYEKTGTIISAGDKEQKIKSDFKMFKQTQSIQEVLKELHRAYDQANRERAAS